MTREDKAYSYLDSLFSGMNYTKAAVLFGASRLGIPGAKRSFRRKVADMAGDKALELGTKLASHRMNIDEDKSLKSVKAVKEIARDMGAPKLGKLIIKK